MLASLLPTPLHPALVHLPIALTLLLPCFALGALWAIRRGSQPLRAWGIATALFALLSASAWAATETGEQTKEQVERVVAERAIETHEEAAEAFLVLSLIALAVAAVGLSRGRVGQAARALATIGAVALVATGWRVGHSGGALVYQHGAAAAYATAGGATRLDAPDRARSAHRDDDER